MLSGGNNAIYSYRLTPEQFMAALCGTEIALDSSGHEGRRLLFGLTVILVANA